eukprot:6211226-Pleurochrysis_carterae.AAC.3
MQHRACKGACDSVGGRGGRGSALRRDWVADVGVRRDAAVRGVARARVVAACAGVRRRAVAGVRGAGVGGGGVRGARLGGRGGGGVGRRAPGGRRVRRAGRARVGGARKAAEAATARKTRRKCAIGGGVSSERRGF